MPTWDKGKMWAEREGNGKGARRPLQEGGRGRGRKSKQGALQSFIEQVEGERGESQHNGAEKSEAESRGTAFTARGL